MKRVSSLLVAIMVLFSCFGTAYAVGEPYRASLTLSRYLVGAFPGDHRGEIRISYDVKASLYANSIGVESFTIYTDDGSPVVTVTGTTANGLIETNSSIHSGDYEYPLTRGDYYAEVTVFARSGTAYDSRTITTSTVSVN